MAAREQSRRRTAVVLGGATLALVLLWAGRRSGQGGTWAGPDRGGDGDGDRGSTTDAGVTALPVPVPKEVVVWLRSGDRIELDGVASDLETTLVRARAVGRARVHASGDARVGWIGKVINELRAAQVTVWADPSLLWDADYVQARAEGIGRQSEQGPRNAAARRRGSLPRYNARRGLWSGGDSRTLYAFTSLATGRTWVVPGGYAMNWGPEATVRVATRDEAEELWQRPLHPGWTVAASPRNAATEPTHIAILRRMGDELFATRPLYGDGVTVLNTSTSVQGAITSAPARGDLQIRGEYTSDGSHWGLGRGRLVARRENGRWLVG